MSASLPARGAIGAALVLLGAASAREAAAGTPGAQWSVELVGTACESERVAFEREIVLACGAVGGTCRIAASPKDAELRAILDCSGPSESWTLETRTVEGTVIDRIDLAGAPADRLREAAVEVARDAAPERVLAIETLRTTLAHEAPTGLENRAEKLTLVLGGRATTTSSRTQPDRGGVHLLGGLALGKVARGTLGFAGEAGGSDDKAMRAFRGGPGIAVGAPFDASSPFGLAAEIGLAATSKYAPSSASSDGAGLLTTKTAFAGYGQTTVTVQWPRAGLRPYASLSAALMSDAAPLVTASGEAGLALALF